MKALDNLNKTRLDGREIGLAWAPSKGIRAGKGWDEYPYWIVETGVSYIPYEQIYASKVSF